MFSEEQRERLRERLVSMAERDHRIVAAALIGGSTAAVADRWSDLDLGFGVAEASVAEVMDDWTASLEAELGAVHLFDLPYLSSVYRVLLFPGALQVDLSFTPASDFGALGPRFRLLFGDALQREPRPPQPAPQVFGLAVHHALRARISIERGRPWQAEHWIGGLRDEALALACRRAGVDPREGRGFDELSPATLAAAAGALPASLEPGELLRALGAAVDLLLAQSESAPALAQRVESELRELAARDPLS